MELPIISFGERALQVRSGLVRRLATIPDTPIAIGRIYMTADRLDKNRSMTDCTSFGAMRQQGIIDALTGDHHVEEAGLVALLK